MPRVLCADVSVISHLVTYVPSTYLVTMAGNEVILQTSRVIPCKQITNKVSQNGVSFLYDVHPQIDFDQKYTFYQSLATLQGHPQLSVRARGVAD